MWMSALWFLGIGVLFYLLMRGGGCGMHAHDGHAHGGEEHEGDSRGDAHHHAMVRDPVCGMEIDASEAAGTTRYSDRTWHFCSATCQSKFLANPDHYAGRA